MILFFLFLSLFCKKEQRKRKKQRKRERKNFIKKHFFKNALNYKIEFIKILFLSLWYFLFLFLIRKRKRKYGFQSLMPRIKRVAEGVAP